MSDARDLTQVIAEAADVARSVGQASTSAHLLLACFVVPCPAAELLRERGVDEDKVLAAMQATPEEDPAIREDILARTREIASGVHAPADTLHLLIAISRRTDCLAHTLLGRSGVPLGALRNTILSWYTSGRLPRQYQAVPATARNPARPAPPPPAAPASPAPPRDLEDDEVVPEVPRAPVQRPRPEPKPGLDSSASRPRAAPARAPRPTSSEHDLDPALYPWLTQLGRNLTAEAAASRLDPVVGRDKEIEEVADILGKRRGNNPVLVGEPGVGKTAIVEGVAQKLLGQPRVLVELDMGSLVAGTALRGSFSERLNGIKDEVRRAAGRVVVFIDELHTIVGAGSTGEGPQDASNELKAALARGEFPCIGATTHDEYRKFIEADPALERRFTGVPVSEPGVPQTLAILKGLAHRYGEHHGVTYEPAALEAAAALSARHITDRCLPDKAIAVIDLAGSRARRQGRSTVGQREVAEVVARMARIPAERLLLDDRERLLALERELGKKVIGHPEVITRVAQAVRRNHAGFAARRPMGSFLFLGPTGVGKTELARALAEVLHRSSDALVRLDMSELSEPHAVARLVGAPPGYLGYGDGGQLSDAVRRRPSSVVLLDEIEKAHRSVQLLLLQVLEDGRLTDSRGRHVDFTQTVVIMTSNLGSEAMSRTGGAVGFGRGGADEKEDKVIERARAELPPELWSRIDEKCVFGPLSREEVARIARLLVADSAGRLLAERKVRLSVADEVLAHLAEAGFDPLQGARPMRQAVQRLLEAPVAEAILRGKVHDGEAIRAVLRGGKVEVIHDMAPRPPADSRLERDVI